MSDAELRARAREAEENADDPAAARAWVAAAERSGAGLSRALAHAARLGDVASHDRLARTLPWPHVDGHGRGRRAYAADRALAASAVDARLVSVEPGVVFRAASGRIEARAPGGAVLWAMSSVPLW
ncbi:MAG TPA: hypothetical protein VFF73_26910, partial [Planctomycetota bacterium]|nr:hypothetical protein [Planctomycetota bacterium]